MKKALKLLVRNGGSQPKKNTDKIWCPEWEQFRYVRVCNVSCKKITRCKAYADYREPRLI